MTALLAYALGILTTFALSLLLAPPWSQAERAYYLGE